MNLCRIPGLFAALALTVGCAPAASPPVPHAPSAEPAAPKLKLVKRFGSLDFRHGEAVRRSIFLDAHTLASAADDAVRIWDLSGKQRTFLPVNAVDIASPPGTGVLIVAETRALSAFKMQGEEARPLWRAELPAEAIPRGLEARGGAIRVVLRDRLLEIDAATGREVKSSGPLPWLADASTASVAPDGSAVVAGHRDATRIHPLAAGSAPLPLSGRAIAFVVSPDSKLVVGFSRKDKTLVEARDLASGEVRWTLDAGSSSPPALGFSPDGSRVALVSAASEAVLVDAATGAVVQKLGLGWNDFNPNYVSIADFSPDGQHLAWGARADVRIWDLAHGAALRPMDPFAIGCAALSPAGDRVALRDAVWDLDRDERLLDLKNPKAADGGYVMGTTFASSSALVAVELETLAFWDLDHRTVKRSEHGGSVGMALAHADHTLLALDMPIGMLSVWRDGADHPLAKLDRNESYGGSDNNYFPDAVASKDRFAVPLLHAVELLDAETGATVGKIDALAGSRALAFSGDGQSLAAALPAGIEIWSPASQSRQQAIPAQSPTAVAFLPGGEVLAYGLTSGKVGLYDTTKRAPVIEALGHHGSVRCLSAGGKRLVSTGSEGTVAVWEIDPR